MKIEEDDPHRPAVTRLLKAHLELMRSLSPPESVHALDLDALCAPSVTFWTAREGDQTLACGALRELDPTHGEIKSMHTSSLTRGRGLGEAMLRHIMNVARERGYERLSLETGRPETFGAAQRLYARHGFSECPPFADYTDDPFSLCMSLDLTTASP